MDNLRPLVFLSDYNDVGHIAENMAETITVKGARYLFDGMTNEDIESIRIENHLGMAVYDIRPDPTGQTEPIGCYPQNE